MRLDSETIDRDSSTERRYENVSSSSPGGMGKGKGKGKERNRTRRADSLLQPSNRVKSTLRLGSSSDVIVVEIQIDPRCSEIRSRSVGSDESSIDPVRVVEEDG